MDPWRIPNRKRQTEPKKSFKLGTTIYVKETAIPDPKADAYETTLLVFCVTFVQSDSTVLSNAYNGKVRQMAHELFLYHMWEQIQKQVVAHKGKVEILISYPVGGVVTCRLRKG